MLEGEKMYKVESFEIDKRKIDIYIPKNVLNIQMAVYVQDSEIFKEISQKLFLEMPKENLPIIIALEGTNRNADYTPWYSKSDNSKYLEFEGRADEYLDFVVNILKPYIESNYADIKSSTILGYSLGGLFSLYAVTKTTCFDKVVSMSGSFWYKDWIEYLKKSNIDRKISVYLNCGKKEGSFKDGLAKGNYGFTYLTYEFLLEKNLKEVVLELDNKNHLNYVAERFIKAFKWIMQN